MGKVLTSKLSPLVLVLLVFQLLFPFTGAFAATTNSSILPPSNLAVQNLTPDDVKLTWSSVYGATGYNVYEITEGQMILRGTTTTPSYNVSNLPEGSYSYVVSTLSAEGESGPCAPVNVEIVYPEMTAPSSLTSTLQNVNNIILSWTSSPYTERYNLYQIGADGQKTLLYSGSNRSYTVSNAPEGAYTFAVDAVNSLYGQSALSAPVQVDIIFPTMQAPSNLSFSITNGNDLTLKWGSVSYANRYKVYEVVDGQLILKSTVTSTSVKYTGVPAGNYVYKVYSESDRFGTSPDGSEVSVTIGEVTMAPPANLTYKIQNMNDIVLSWTAASYANSYKVYQMIDGQPELKSTVTSTSVSYSKMPAGDYTFQVNSYSDRFGESEESGTVSFSIAEVIMTPPANLTYTVKNLNDIALSWTAAPNATSYKVYQIIDGQPVLKSTLTGTTVTYTNMPAGGYTYKVYSVSDRFGESAEGSEVSLTLEAVIMAPPSDLTYEIKNLNDIVLNWTAAPNATSYNVYQIIDGQPVLKSTVTGTTVSYTNMPAGNYVYKVHSVSSRFGESADGNMVSLTLDPVIMAAPGNFAYQVQNGNDITLTWDPVANATNYRIYQIVNGQKVLKNTVTNTGMTYTNMPEGEYSYKVYSYSTRFGESQEGSTLTLSLVHPTMLPPENVIQTIKNATDFTLSWDPSSYATSYKVYMIVDGNKTVRNTTGTTLSYTNMASGEYQFEIHSYSSRFGESLVGSFITVVLNGETMEAPTNLTYNIINGNDVTLKWDAAEFATSYKIYQVVDGQQVYKTTVTTLYAKFTNSPGGDNHYVVTSVSKLFGESATGADITFSLVLPTMTRPANLAYTIQNGNDVVLSWDAVQYANSYTVYELVEGQEVYKASVTSLSKTFSNVPEGDHTYVVHSVSTRFGESTEGSEISFPLVFPEMAAPENVTYSIANGNDITLKWNSVTYGNSYKVYQVIDGLPVLQSTLSGTTITYTNKPAGEYIYEIHSVSSRFGESAEAGNITFTLVHPVMQAPGNFTYSITNGNDITLRWNTVTYAKNYNVYQIIDGQKELVRTVTGSALTLTNMPEGDYVYEVDSYSDRFGESPVGSNVSFPLVHPIMQAPGNFTQSITNGNDLTLRWNAAEYAKSYNVYQVIDGQKEWIRTLTGTSLFLSNMPEGDYVYEVTSYSDRFGESPQSSSVSFTMVFPVMQPPGNPAYSISSGNDITLRWNAATYANSYNVYQIIDGQPVWLRNVTSTSTKFINMPEGDYNYEVRSVSTRFGESPDGSKISFTLTWPVVQAPTLAGTVFNVNNITLTWNSVSWANEYRVYQTTGDSKQLVYKGTALTTKVYNMTEDTHSFEVTAYSIRFGESILSNKVTQTIVYPEMQPPTANLILKSDTSAWIYWNFITYANGYNIYEMIDGELVLVAEKVNNLSYTVNNLSYANHQYVVTSYSNSFGESKPSNTVLAKLIIDTEAPVTTAQAVAGWTNQDQVVTLSATDNETGVQTTYYSLNGSAYAAGTSIPVTKEGINTISFYSVDKVGNTETAKTIEMKLDKTAPSTTTEAPPVWSKDDVTMKLVATDAVSGVAETFFSVDGSVYVKGTDVVISEEGIHTLSFHSVDQAGNVGSEQTVEIKVDKTTPVSIANVPEGWSNESVTVQLNVTDNLSGVSKTFYSINGSPSVEGTLFTVEEEGINTVTFYSVDTAGNTEASQTVEVKIDKTAPETASDAPAEWSNEDVTVKLNATDAISGVAGTFYSVDNSVYTEGTEVTFNEEGIHTLSFHSVDYAGNVGTEQTVEVKVDKSAPVISWDIAEEYALGATVDIAYAAADSVSGIASESVTINGQVQTKGGQITLDAPGIYTAVVTVTDQAGWTTALEKTFEVYIPADLIVNPGIIKGNKGKFTVKAVLPAGFDPNGFDLQSATLNGVAAIAEHNGDENKSERGHFRFNREEFNWGSGEMVVEFRAMLDGYLVVGRKTVKVVAK